MRYHVLAHSLLECHIQHHTHIAHALGGQRAMIAQITGTRLFVEKALQHLCTDLTNRHLAQCRNDVFFAVVAVMRIAGGLCGWTHIGFQPIHQPLPQRRMFIKFSIVTRHIIFLLFQVQKRCAGCFSLRNAMPSGIRKPTRKPLRSFSRDAILMVRCSKCCCAGG